MMNILPRWRLLAGGFLVEQSGRGVRWGKAIRGRLWLNSEIGLCRPRWNGLHLDMKGGESGTFLNRVGA